MKPKTTKILYWTAIPIFSLLMLMDGIAGLMRVEGGKQSISHLGYPVYLLSIVGFAKVCGVIALIQTKYPILKEWAYAGFTISFIGAFASRAFVGDSVGLLIPPIVMLAIMFGTYFLWKRYSSSQQTNQFL
ncbi:MAG: DoxX family protein [Mucilaginibacter sp.]|nr:DoxX family protein [Mucilaginibacter sp.]